MKVIDDPILDSDLAKLFDLMGRGWRLRVPHDGSTATLRFTGFRDILDLPEYYNVKPDDAARIASGEHFHIKRHAVYDRGFDVWARKLEEIDGRLGWRECGYDGNMADWYCLGF